MSYQKQNMMTPHGALHIERSINWYWADRGKLMMLKLSLYHSKMNIRWIKTTVLHLNSFKKVLLHLPYLTDFDNSSIKSVSCSMPVVKCLESCLVSMGHSVLPWWGESRKYLGSVILVLIGSIKPVIPSCKEQWHFTTSRLTMRVGEQVTRFRLGSVYLGWCEVNLI